MENLKMIRGDTLAFGFEIEGVTGLDGAYFSVKKTKHDDEYIIQKKLNDGVELVESGKYSVRVAPADTHDLGVGTYYYDLQIEVNGDIFTVLYGTLEIEADITREVAEAQPIREGSYYLQLEADGYTLLEVISFALESNTAVAVIFEGIDTISTFLCAYARVGNNLTITINGTDYNLIIVGSTLYYQGIPLIYKPNFDVDYINEVFEEVNNG